MLQKIWLSALVVEGSIITREVGVVFLVFHASAFGFIGIRVRLVAKYGLVLLDVTDAGIEVPTFNIVTDARAWKAVAFVALVLGDPRRPPEAPRSETIVAIEGEAEQLLSFSVKRGLRGLSVAMLRKLYD